MKNAYAVQPIPREPRDGRRGLEMEKHNTLVQLGPGVPTFAAKTMLVLCSCVPKCPVAPERSELVAGAYISLVLNFMTRVAEPP